MCVRSTPPKWNMVVGSCGNATDGGKRFEKGFGSGTGGSTGVQKKKSRGNGPATERCGTTQVKAKTKTTSRHFRDGIALIF
jgi:hypothetical protein